MLVFDEICCHSLQKNALLCSDRFFVGKVGVFFRMNNSFRFDFDVADLFTLRTYDFADCGILLFNISVLVHLSVFEFDSLISILVRNY